MDVYIHVGASCGCIDDQPGSPAGSVRLLSREQIRKMYPGIPVSCKRDAQEVIKIRFEDDDRHLFWPAAAKNHAARLKREEEDEDGDE